MELKQFGNLEVRLFNNLEEFSKQAAEIFAAECEKTLKKKAIFTVSFCGGKTPQRLFELLSAEFKNKFHWPAVHIFWGDERPSFANAMEGEGKKGSSESNFQNAYKIWLEKIIKVSPSFKNNIHRLKMELGLVRGAKEYEKELSKLAPEGFDLSFNGAGSDGHRNGIFPEKPKIGWKNEIWDLPESVKVYGYTIPPEINPYTKRITLTPWFLNKSKVNILMLSGKDKADLLKKITRDKEKYTKRDLPAITFNDVPTIVLADKAAVSKI
ncbi:6-phosphogluconolactonase [Patescibacteria group bacterium]|nr:6-phosphogluconolactonase [Patescibacteria group bacterium]MBU4481183.1 6-phosphogluconolactonase [Patescibacteria group bacterium]